MVYTDVSLFGNPNILLVLGNLVNTFKKLKEYHMATSGESNSSMA